MSRLNNMPTDRVVELALEQEYRQALAYVARHHAGLAEAEEAFTRLQAYKRAMAQQQQLSQQAAEQSQQRAA